MKPFLMQETWLGTLITMEVAAQFAWLSLIAIALRSAAPQRKQRR
jgi:hypothetical protein